MDAKRDARTVIEAAMKALFVPRLREAGFKGSLPHLRRVGEERVDLVSVQFRREGGGLCIELGVCSPGGLVMPWGELIPVNKATALHTYPDQGRRRLLLRDGQGDCWFWFNGGHRGDRTAFHGTAEECARAAAEAMLTRGEAFFRAAPRWWVGKK